MPRSSTHVQARPVFSLSWVALRAGVLRRAVSHWRPVPAAAEGGSVFPACVGRTRMAGAACSADGRRRIRAWVTPQKNSLLAVGRAPSQASRRARMNELRFRHSHSPVAPLPRLTAQRGRTPRSTGPATACALARAAVSVIIRRTGQAARRSGPVTSNVRHHRTALPCA
jgi:hypothetical protein